MIQPVGGDRRQLSPDKHPDSTCRRNPDFHFCAIKSLWGRQSGSFGVDRA